MVENDGVEDIHLEEPRALLLPAVGFENFAECCKIARPRVPSIIDDNRNRIFAIHANDCSWRYRLTLTGDDSLEPVVHTIGIEVVPVAEPPTFILDRQASIEGWRTD